jgi:hypothetical protein
MSNNPYINIISPELKAVFNNAIDALLQQNALTVQCRLRYSGQQNSKFCSNCIFDAISQLSSNIYNGTGSNPFSEGSICPVCMGMGMMLSDSSEIVSLACIFDSKYFVNYSSKTINIPAGTIQTICHSSLLPKIRNANDVVVDTTLEQYGNYIYQRAGDPEPIGFGDNRYIATIWSRK